MSCAFCINTLKPVSICAIAGKMRTLAPCKRGWYCNLGRALSEVRIDDSHELVSIDVFFFWPLNGFR